MFDTLKPDKIVAILQMPFSNSVCGMAIDYTDSNFTEICYQELSGQ